MIALLESPKVDVAAVAQALDGLRPRGATRQAYLRADGHDVCVNAVNAGGDDWPEYSEAASRRAAARGRRLLPVLGGGKVDGRHWIAYDMGSTTSLPKHAGHPLPTATCIRVLADVARALDDAAGEGMFACELPPDSVFVSRRGAHLGDLGTARDAIAGATFELEGDPAFVPPEVLQGQRAGDRSGVYLFGALLYHLITGASPRRGRSAPLAGPRPHLPVSITSIVATVMADDPESRPASAGEAYDMARRALRGEPQARPSGGPRRVRAPKQGAAPKPGAAAKPNGAAPKPKPVAPKPAPASKSNSANAPTPAKLAELAAALKRSWSASQSPESPDKSAAAKPAVTNSAPSETANGKSAKEPESGYWQWPSRSARKPAGSKLAATKRETRKPHARKAVAAAPVRERPATRKPSPPAVGAKLAGVATGLATAVVTKLSQRKPSLPRPKRHRPNVSAGSGRRSSTAPVASPGRRYRAVAVGGALLFGAAAGVLLGRSPDPAPARAQDLTAGGLSVTLPPGWQPADSGDESLSVRAGSGVSLQARLVDRPFEPQQEYKAVQLGAYQLWRRATPGAAVYTAPTSKGTLVVTCRASASVGSGPLRECERAASTLRLHGGRALPLTAALEESKRLRAAVAALGTQRNRARTRLSRASTPRSRRLLAQDLARIHARAATALDGLPKADSIEAAARRAAAAYKSLAPSAESGSPRRWNRAGERVRRSEAELAKAIATAG